MREDSAVNAGVNVFPREYGISRYVRQHSAVYALLNLVYEGVRLCMRAYQCIRVRTAVNACEAGFTRAYSLYTCVPVCTHAHTCARWRTLVYACVPLYTRACCCERVRNRGFCVHTALYVWISVSTRA